MSGVGCNIVQVSLLKPVGLEVLERARKGLGVASAVHG